MHNFQRFLPQTDVFLSINRVCFACRVSQVICRRTFLKKASKEDKAEKKAQRKLERQKLVGEITKGYFADLREYGEKGGKRFFAAETLLDQKTALSFPEITGRNLHKREIKLNEEFSDNVALVLMWLRAIGQNMCDLYRQPFLEKFQMNPNIKCFEVNVVDGIFFKFMKPFIEKSLQQQIPIEKQDRYICYYGNTEEIKNNLIENIIVGHAFLVDGMGRVRWKAHGRPTDEEIQFMIKCTEDLLKENQKYLSVKYKS